MPKKNDFIIVGGGLVGCLVSLILSKKNYTIYLVEKKTFKHIISDDFTPLSLTINTIQFLKKNNLWDSSYIKATEIKAVYDAEKDAKKWLAYPPLGLISAAGLATTTFFIRK